MADSSGKILIIDDDSRNIFALKAVLQSRGYVCIAATSGMEGLQLLDHHTDVGIVLLDMMMPGVDGYETIHLLRQRDQLYLPIISVTAQAMVGDREKCLEAGADDYISKPIDVDHLLTLLEKYLTKQ